MIRVFTDPCSHRDPGAAAHATRPGRLLTTLLLVVTLALVLAGAPHSGAGLTGIAYAAAAAPPTPSPHARRTAKNGAIPARTFNASHIQTPTDVEPDRIIYVDRDATGVINGSSWTNAFVKLQDALAVTTAIPGGEVWQMWVAEGVYYPDEGVTDNDEGVRFIINPHLQLYGGFAGTEITLDERDWQAHKTILSGDIEQDDDNTDGNFIDETTADIVGTNSDGVVETSSVDSTTRLDGFIITGGYAGGWGGGIYAAASSAQYYNLELRGNYAQSYGGGMYVESSTVNIENTVFSGNSAPDAGGFYGDDDAHTTMTNVSFSGNSEPEVRSCSVSGDNSITLRNSILWGGNGTEELRTYESYESELECTSTVDVTYSDIYQESGVYAGIGNKNLDPLYVAPAAGDLRLAINSPVIDAGDNGTCTATDLLGVTRPQGSACDMGAYEVEQPVYLTKSVTPTSVTYHGEATYTLLLSNPGAWGGTAWITDTLPAQVDFGQWIENHGAEVTNDQITWHGAVGTSSLTFRFTATHVGTHNDVVTNVAEFDGPAQTKSSAKFTVPCANSYTVTNGNDAGEGSLRLGIAEVCDGSTISFNGDTSIYLASELGIDKALAIDGTGHAVTVSGDTNHDGSRDLRPFNIDASGVVTLTHMTIDSGIAPRGGGIYNGGTLTVRNSTLTNNAATIDGGGAYNDGTLTIVNSTLSNNSATGNGGAILSGGSLTVTSATLSSNTANLGGGIYTTGGTKVISSTLSRNSASEYGGAIANYDYGNLTIEASTLMDNHTSKGGGGVYIFNWATTNLLNSTIEGNSVDAFQYGGGIDQNGGTLYARNSTIAGNTGRSIGAGLVNWAGPIHLTNMVIAYNEGGDCYNPQSSELATNDHNLIGSTEASWANCGIADGAGGTRVGIDPQLGPLADNGGPTLTRAALYGSPVKNSGSTNCPAADQRGVPRSDDACDIGAYEVVVPLMVPWLTIEATGGNAVRLNWPADWTAPSYEVWTAANQPYFTLAPGASCASPAPYRCTVTTATEFPDATALGDPSENYTYRVRALFAIGSGPLSADRVGGFTFTLAR